MILVTIMDHYLIFAMLFMQLRGEPDDEIIQAQLEE